jgi:hypothetical protein
MKRFFIAITVLVLGVIVGIPLGARLGVREFMLADAQYKASSLSSDLKALRAGNSKRIIEGMELSLNAELAKHGEYMESRLWWLWPEFRTNEDRHIRNAVSYRLANPYQGPDLSKAENWKPGVDMNEKFIRDVVEGQRHQEAHLRNVLDRYRVTPNSSQQPSPNPSAAERGR